jgi:hypothetical protein
MLAKEVLEHAPAVEKPKVEVTVNANAAVPAAASQRTDAAVA